MTLVETVSLGGGLSVVRMPDLDGRFIYVCSYGVSEKAGFGMPAGRSEIMGDIASREMMIFGKLDERQRDRLDYATNVLKLPTILAVHAALNTDKVLTDFPVPEEKVNAPVILGMAGKSGAGKSLAVAVLSVRRGYPIMDLDPVSGTDASVYTERFREQFGVEELKVITVEQAERLVGEEKVRAGGNRDREPKTLKKMLDTALEVFAKTSERPELILADLPGRPGMVNYGRGRTHGRERELNVFDWLGPKAFEDVVVSTNQLTSWTMERKLRWIENEVILKNLPRWQQKRMEFGNAVKM
ncbi:MAG: hypothetical protein G01um101416_959 [Microgenomates group bacterium Gr01-1014_16]|nr:MAG: hypothetical protein G01um101416_959 [Microgenomates group bacterium Gr01-1014_16]